MLLDTKLKQDLIRAQRNELTEHRIYNRLVSIVRDEKNREVIKHIAQDEARHANFFAELTEETVKPDFFKISFFVLIARLLGLTFSIKLLERKEDFAQDSYARLSGRVPGLDAIIEEESRHERELIELIDEERLRYVSSMVLGLNDALVELTGALVGFTFALQNTRLIAVVGLITGIAAAMSMAASEYLSTKQEHTNKDPLKASLYTGFAYVATVLILITPYLIFSHVFTCLVFVITNALLIILFFTFYISVAKGLSFKKRFAEMAGISLGIALINFGIGLIIRHVFGIEA